MPLHHPAWKHCRCMREKLQAGSTHQHSSALQESDLMIVATSARTCAGVSRRVVVHIQQCLRVQQKSHGMLCQKPAAVRLAVHIRACR